jgi:hypothetical protein
MKYDTDQRRLLYDWWRRARESQHGHHESAKMFRFLSWLIEGPSVCMPFALGAIALVHIGHVVPPRMVTTFAVLGVMTSVLTIFHLYFRFYETARNHVALGAQYGNVRREIESFLLAGSKTDQTDGSEFVSIRKKLDELAVKEPVVPSFIFRATLRKLKGKERPAVIVEIEKEFESSKFSL